MTDSWNALRLLRGDYKSITYMSVALLSIDKRDGVSISAFRPAPRYHDRDILVTGAFLHDIGKTREILWDITKDYTTEGKMLGHIILGVMMLKEKVSS